MDKKYRIWHKAEQRMLEPRYIEFVPGQGMYVHKENVYDPQADGAFKEVKDLGPLRIDGENVIFLESTGAKDRNKNDVFPGDVCEFGIAYVGEDNDPLAVVYWDPEHLTYKLRAVYPEYATTFNGHTLSEFANRITYVMGNCYKDGEFAHVG